MISGLGLPDKIMNLAIGIGRRNFSVFTIVMAGKPVSRILKKHAEST
jgi:hypothetical protein